MLKITPLKIVYLVEILIVLLIVFGLVPREAALFLLGILIFYIIFQPLEDGLMLFIASIPIFIALPITTGFDSLSSARVIILILFLKWLFNKREIIWENFKLLSFKKILKDYRLEFLAIVLFLILALSVMYAVDVASAIKKIIYLANLAVLFLIVKDFVKNSQSLKRIIRAIFACFGLVLLIGLGQLISVYFFTFGSFWTWWADHFSLGFYGENLRKIVSNMNSWFTHSASGRSAIRVFGSFTDPHSFALYLLLVVPFLITFMFSNIKKAMIKQKIPWNKLGLLILIFFFIILSGTRGIWFGLVFGLLAGIYLMIKKKKLRPSILAVILTLLIFITLIPVSSIFTIIPQFREQEGDIDTALLLKRLASILDLDEASNQGRIYIWRQSIKSFKQNPLLGIGIGNFPIALSQDVALAKAGSSAHNLYLNFLVEAGLFALIVIVLMVLDILKTIFSNLKLLSFRIRLLMIGLFIYLVWVFGYSLFDIALLDERVFLLFLTILGIIYGIKTNINKHFYL